MPYHSSFTLTLSLIFLSAPAASRVDTMLTCPLRAPQCRGVYPFYDDDDEDDDDDDDERGLAG